MREKLVRESVTAERWNAGRQAFEPEKTLLSALGFSEWKTLPRVVSLVGAGGKTSTMYDLAEELAAGGAKVLITTSTHIMKPEQYKTIVADRIADALADPGAADSRQSAGTLPVPDRDSGENESGKPDSRGGRIVALGKQASGKGAEHKLTMPDDLGEEAVMKQLLEWVDVILIEADGSKRLPLKVPSETEPVLVSQTGLVIACAGLSAGEKTFGEACFRFDGYGAWLKRSADDRILPEDLALILMDERGSRKGVGGRYYRIVLNQADTETEKARAEETARLLPVSLQQGCIRTTRKHHAAVCAACESWYAGKNEGEGDFRDE